MSSHLVKRKLQLWKSCFSLLNPFAHPLKSIARCLNFHHNVESNCRLFKTICEKVYTFSQMVLNNLHLLSPGISCFNNMKNAFTYRTIGFTTWAKLFNNWIGFTIPWLRFNDGQNFSTNWFLKWNNFFNRSTSSKSFNNQQNI